MRLILIRHGQTQWNQQRRIQGWQDSPLTSQAITQLKALALPELRNPVLFSSDLGRAQDSARIIAKRIGSDINSDIRLRERKFGLLEGQIIDKDEHLSDYWAMYHRRYSEKMTSVFGVESETDFEQRIVSFVAELDNLSDKGDVVIVGHGEWLRALTNILQGIPSWHLGCGIMSNASPQVIDRHVVSQVVN
ncbi:histidine phosphatase family protein [Vibrio sp. JC009]|uniref:histidine phosphatase family protein n=1 Tax=Vibrio sp. JC009 TaxID=2912314 RepID=UPI0023AF8E05|nr:histidine phosphatase family protein [Vibrio sp. JC009]WED24587.1 histidine phosphatase family protein [Vibrio sp. JC009]